MPDGRINVLVICSRNQWRSPTAEKLINRRPGYAARSAGTASAARVLVNERHIRWALIILVMEHRHARQLRERFGDLLAGRRIHCLDVADKYRYMDPELVALLEERISRCLAGP